MSQAGTARQLEEDRVKRQACGGGRGHRVAVLPGEAGRCSGQEGETRGSESTQQRQRGEELLEVSTPGRDEVLFA